MYKLTIGVLLVFSVGAKAQDLNNFNVVDSITYQYYLAGNWDKLIEISKKAISMNIDFKYLRQRMGYAYFMKSDYFASQRQYEKALEFDEFDPITLEYLYYCGLNTGNIAYARLQAKKLTPEAKKRLGIHAINPVASLDIEYNYKLNNIDTRTDASYYRAGIYTQAGYRLSIYQSASNYKQTVNDILVKQPEYFALANLALSKRTLFSLGYHHLNTSLDGYKYPGDLVYSSVSARISRFVLGVNGSLFRYDVNDIKQVGTFVGVTLPGKSNVYFNSYLSGMLEKGNNRLVFAQYAGALVLKSLWAEVFATMGNLQNYNDHNALYMYNSIDPTLFRTGLTLYWNISNHVTLFGNYIYDTKQVEQTTNQYIQQSFSGGLIWKR